MIMYKLSINWKIMKLVLTLFYGVLFTRAEPVARHAPLPQPSQETRRIHGGKPVGETRPYMVYLKPVSSSEAHLTHIKWLCGGVIIHPRFILTSAACIEDVNNFAVVSGTHKWTANYQDNECVKNGMKKAVWKCTPQKYFFDGADFDNIRWMSGDIAVVKLEEEFNFVKRIKGCDFIPKMINFNNISEEYEKPGTMGSIAGWGSNTFFGDVDVGRSSANSPDLLETDVQIISKKNCKKRWEARYHNIIDQSMICTKDDQDTSLMSEACLERGANCKELEYSHEYAEDYLRTNEQQTRRLMVEPSELEVHGSRHHHSNNTRRYKVASGGFCENDHGGPLIVGHGTTSMVIGIITACMAKDITKKCYGPFLYTSVWNYRHLISCALHKDIGSSETCRKAFGDLKTSDNQISEINFDMQRNDHKE